MKNIWIKFKQWLIRKLGGYVQQPERVHRIETFCVNPITIQATLTVPDTFDDQKYIEEKLCRQLAEQAQQHIEIATCCNFSNPFEKTYRATLRIIPKYK